MKQVPETFPDNFLWSGAFAACQCEGEYDKDGRGLSTSGVHEYAKGLSRAKIEKEGGRTLVEIKHRAVDTESCYPKRYGTNFYHTYKDDPALLREMGFKCFRTNISWSRIFLNGDEAELSEAELKLYNDLIDEIVRDDMEPIITMSHYDIPLHLVTEYGGFGNRKVIDLFVSYGKVLVGRFQGRVKYWIVYNQVNLVPTMQFGSLGIYDDQAENMGELMYQAVHNQFVACAKIKEVGHQIDPHAAFGTILADCTFYSATRRPKDVVLTMKKSGMRYSFSDVQLHGEYLVYALHYSKEGNINVQIEDGDEEVIRSNTIEFLAISYYYNRVVGSDKNDMTPMQVEQNPNLEPTPWERRMDPLGFYNCLSQYWDRYQIPLMIGENSFGALDTVEADGSIHDPYRIDFLKKHIEQMKECIRDRVYIFAYYAWGPIDTVSPSSAETSKRYGFAYVSRDGFGKSNQKRLKKDSFYWHTHLIETSGSKLQGTQRVST